MAEESSPAPAPASRWVCIVCGAERPLDDPAPWRCPRATADDRHHVLHAELGQWSAAPPTGWTGRSVDPFVANDRRMAWTAAAAARGVGPAERAALVEHLDQRLLATGSPAFAPTPLMRSTLLSDELGFAGGGGVWVKDETGNVGGSHKARHLQSILLHLGAGTDAGGALAIASCGNAAIAAAVLARAADRPLDVFVPTWMGAEVGDLLTALGARITRCERRSSDPPGDPAMHRFREAVEDGAVPFTVQGPENALCLDGGRTLGWEVLDQAAVDGLPPFSRIFAQVGGGAFAADLGATLCPPGGPSRLHPVQAAGCAPLVRAWQRAADAGIGADGLGSHWDELMTPWSDPSSLADGILDDETYDWLDVCRATAHSGGRPVVATERHIADAHGLAQRAGFLASPTGSAGLAGLLAVRGEIDPGERVLVVATGVER